MIKSALGKVAWVGRIASMVFGLALVLALVFGLASTALSATGGNFILGKANGADRVSKLTASIAGPALTLVNQSTEAAATALNITVASGKPPLKVNTAAGTATNLSADELDGKDSTAFVSGTGSMTSVDERFSDPDGAGGAKGFSSALTVPGAQIRAACLQQSSGIEMFLDHTNDASTVSLWRDDGGATPTAKTLESGTFDPGADSDSSPVSAADRVIWHGSSAAGTFTAVLFTRYEGDGNCHWSGYVLSN